MAFPALLGIIPIGILFIFSGLVVNLIQAVVFILICPVSKNLYRRVNNFFAELLWLETIWLVDWWANLKIKLYADDEMLELMGKEHALLICNHRSDIDWLVGWVLAERAGCLGSTLAVMKKEVKLLPVIGWSMWFSGYVFLERSWEKDKGTLKSGYGKLADFPIPFWLALFVEGTRFTQEKLEAAQEFAVSRGLPIPRNVLLPRTKGFVSAVKHMRSFVPAIYDCTVSVQRDQPTPTLLRIFRRQPSVVNVEIRRHTMQELPETADGIAQWCRDTFVTKDVLLEKHLTTGIFSDLKLQNIGRPQKSLLVVICWSCLLIFGIFRFFQWLLYLGAWEVIAFSVSLVALVAIVMQILIHSSESGRSTPPTKPASSREDKLQLLVT